MNLIDKKIGDIVLTMDQQALPIVDEVWQQEIYNKIYSIKKGDTVIDIGANVGIFSLYAAVKGARVYCFEPNPEIYEILLKNIQTNSFESEIKPFNMALGDIDGYIELFVPNTNDIYSESLASTDKRFIEDITRKTGRDFRKFSVLCRKLETILDDLEIDQIDFIKLDCEGAEFDIIKCSSVDAIRKVKNISLEVHGACYTEKELCQLFLEKELCIDHLIEVSEPSLTGYLYATRNNKCEKSKLISVIDSKKYAYCNEQIELDGSNSFLTNKADYDLVYRWSIDGKDIPDSSESISYMFSNPGFHQVSLEVECDGKKEKSIKEILVIKPGYHLSTVDYKLDGINSDFQAIINSERNFLISSDSIPKYNSFDIMIISINKTKSVFQPLWFEFNDEKVLLSKQYTEIRVGYIPPGLDVIFSIKPFKSGLNATDVSIRWWVGQQDGTPKDEKASVVEGNNLSYLSTSGHDDYFLFEGKKNFTINKDMLPSTWVPKEIVIGITSVTKYNKKLIKLSGHLAYLNKETPISEYYSEVHLDNLDFERDVSFSIELPELICLKIAWWCS